MTVELLSKQVDRDPVAIVSQGGIPDMCDRGVFERKAAKQAALRQDHVAIAHLRIALAPGQTRPGTLPGRGSDVQDDL